METTLIWAGSDAGYLTLFVAGSLALAAAGLISMLDAGRKGTALMWAMLTITIATWVLVPMAAARMIAPAEVLSGLDGCAKGALLGDNQPDELLAEPIRMKHVRDVVDACERLIEDAPKVLERARIREEQEKALRAEEKN